jgi:hypothetical protein
MLLRPRVVNLTQGRPDIALPRRAGSIAGPVMTDNPAPACIRLRHALAFPLYVVALVLAFVSEALCCLAAWIAGDGWRRHG